MLQVQEFNSNAHIPVHVRGIIAAVIEEAKAFPNAELHVEHDQQFQRTRIGFRNGAEHKNVVANLSHVVYPEETLVVSFEDRQHPVTVPPSEKIAGDTAFQTFGTKTRHYQPAVYLGKNQIGLSNSRLYATDVSRRDEAVIATDIFQFIQSGVAPN